MGDVYWVGVFLGLGIGIGVLLAGILGASRAAFAAAIVVAVALGAGLGFALGGIEDSIAGGIGGAIGAAATQQLLSGTLRRGGTRLAAAALLAVVAIAVGLLAFVPLVGFLEAVALPALGARLRRREPARYAGLRSLARD
jgi:asparagine N-glycosylation enzyme membrane subunit Stt3